MVVGGGLLTVVVVVIVGYVGLPERQRAREGSERWVVSYLFFWVLYIIFSGCM